jgi:hypothetical protein
LGLSLHRERKGNKGVSGIIVMNLLVVAAVLAGAAAAVWHLRKKPSAK